jgi:uncharacterized protein YdeI (YjbR/CyaY-like superfamily)
MNDERMICSSIEPSMSNSSAHRPSTYGNVTPSTRAAWRTWLQKHHTSSTGVWLHFAKKHSKLPTVSYNDAVEEALCFGWIDGLTHPVDDTYYKQAFTPRKPKSAWAATNKARVEKLIAAKLMTPAGLAAIAQAKANGMWTKYDAVEAGTMPPDLKKALASAGVRKVFDAWTPGRQKQCFYYLTDAKKPETRAKRIAKIVEAATSGRTPFEVVTVR